MVANFDGFQIYFYHDEQPPAHFHVRYAMHEAMIEMSKLEAMEGSLPQPQLRKIRDWARRHPAQLNEAWHLCRSDLDPGKIA
jgi:hypothetical protein